MLGCAQPNRPDWRRPVPEREDWIMNFTVGVVGAGRVGAVLGAALAAAGHRVVAASGASPVSRARIHTLLPTAGALPADEVAAAAELVLIAVPDDVLGAVVAGLAGTGALRSGQVVVHTAGAHGVGVLEPAAALGWPCTRR
jgi:predicted short-subunit dehydrogenase-like oxidoreductase (DUF2520 family)